MLKRFDAKGFRRNPVSIDQIPVSSIRESAGFLISKIEQKPVTGIISGTGLESLSGLAMAGLRFPVSQIPNFPCIGQNDRAIISGTIKGHPVVILTKRLHLYEGFSMNQIAFTVRLFKELGVNILILTNAAGGLNPLFSSGRIMIITDHINLMGGSPLTGPNQDEYGPRFPDMTEPYDNTLISLMEETAVKKDIPLLKGVYAGVPGPNLETRAETRFLRAIGADAVGMSTVPEVIASVHCGIRVLGLSVISNINLPDSPRVYTLEEIIGAVQKASSTVMDLLEGFVAAVSDRLKDGLSTNFNSPSGHCGS
ncbi:purine-nucleoside phosphorylase [bacterium]|nr:purine-nucleoside phosphorylase [bacterium]